MPSKSASKQPRKLSKADLDRIDHLYDFLNMTAKSGYIDPRPVIEEIGELLGNGASKAVKDILMALKNTQSASSAPSFALAVTTQGTFRFNNVTGDAWLLREGPTGYYWAQVKNNFVPPTKEA